MSRADNQAVIESITEALLQLMDVKPFREINVKELTAKAGVGRVSFYRNFDSKEDVLQRHVEKITQGFVKTQKFRYEPDNMREYTVMLFEHLERHKALCLTLLKNNFLYIIGDMFDKYFLRDKPSKQEQFYQMYVSGGYFNVFKLWLMNGCKETPEEMADMLCGMSKGN